MSSRQSRLVRSIVLGALAVAAGVGWLAVELGMDRRVLAEYALTSLALVAVLVVLAVAGAVVLRLVRRIIGRR